jgi:cysteine desulfurase/selenocysteine lyase
MTTSNGSQYPELPKNLDWNGAALAAEAGLPDPAVLARLANDFFAAGSRQTNGPEVPVVPTVGGQSIPSGAYGQQVPALPVNAVETKHVESAATGNLPLNQSTGSSALPGIPGGFQSGQISSEPVYSFIQEARSLFGAVPAIPAQPSVDSIRIPTDSTVRDFPASIPGNPEQPVDDLWKDVAAPQIPGSVLHDSVGNRPGAYGFLDEATPIVGDASAFATKGITPELVSTSIPASSADPFDVQTIRRDFPILQERVNGRQLIWLDNAATTQKPQSVIDRLSYFYQHENSNIHRAAHALAARATDAYEAAREKVRRFLNASSANEIVFVRGATEGVNLVAQSWGRQNIHKDDEIIVTWLEHHANIVPWQQLAAETGAKLRVVPVNDRGELLLDEYEKLFSPRTRLVSVTHVSNALGTVTPVAELVHIAHRHGVRILVDGAQAVSHLRVDLQLLDADFYVFSGHKIFAPTGIGVVFGKADLLNTTQPWQGGGNMIADVTFERTVYQLAPSRYEAGTGNIADAVGLGAAIEYVERVGLINIARYEHDLLVYATDALQRIPGLRLIGTAKEKASVLSFVLDGFRTEDIGSYLNQEGIAVRSGHHCAQPILRRFGVESTVRPSLAFYNTCEEVDALVAAIWNLKNGRSAGVV